MKANAGFVVCAALSAVSFAFLLAALITPELARMDLTLTVNGTDGVPVTSQV
jgi:hypothetical protein